MNGHQGRRFAPPPVTAQIIRRERLYDRLAVRPAALVLGSAGYGKSMLLASWLDAMPPAGVVAWLALGASHQDAGRLAADLLAALRTPVAGSLGGSLGALEAPPAFADHLAFIDSIHQGLFDAEIPLTLVLDDVQHLAGSARALAVVDHFIAWAPPSTRVVLASRSMPGLRLQRLRLEDRLEFIGHADLAFTEEETASAVRSWGVQLGADVVAELHALTQGWPAAVRMAVLAMRAGARRDVMMALRKDDALAGYLTTEVLGSLAPELREFVVDATGDEVVCPSLVDDVRGALDSGTLLERCVEDGLFLTPESGADGEPWFRWHGLFATHMRAHRSADTVRAAELERRAALWWRDVDADVAVTHALAAHADELAGEIVASAWLGVALGGRADTCKRMAAAVPDHVRSAAESHLALAFVAAEEGAIDVARAELAAARRLSGRLAGADLARFEMRAAVIELFVVRDRAALTESLARGHRLLDAAASGSVDVDVPTVALVRLYVGMSEARLLDNPLEAVRLLRQARATADHAGYAALGLMARAESCIPSIALGHILETRQIAEQVIAEANSKGWGDLPGTATAYGYLGWLALWRGKPRRALRLLARCADNLLPNDWGMLGLVTTVHAQACLSAADLDGAERDCRQGRHLAEHGRMPEWWPSLLTSLDAMVLAERGHVDEARLLVERPSDGPDFHLATCYRAIVQLRADRPDRTLEILDTIPPDRMYPHVAGTVEALRAQGLAETGDGAAAQVALERALGTSETFGFLEPYRLVGIRLLPLLTDHLHTGTRHRDHAAQVVRRLSAELQPAAANWGETLTRRERSILSFLATDLSHTEIAQAECISVNTVKTHVAHIFRKLEVANRRAAVRRAAELGIR